MICSMYSFLSYLDIDDCQPNPCKNDGVCEDGANSFTCNCAHGFIGEDCNIGMRQFLLEVTCIWNQIQILYQYPYLYLIDIDDCIGDPCQSGGTCIDEVASFQCKCPVGFTGLTCEISMFQNPFCFAT